jgi:hypothetical protein
MSAVLESAAVLSVSTSCLTAPTLPLAFQLPPVRPSVSGAGDKAHGPAYRQRTCGWWPWHGSAQTNRDRTVRAATPPAVLQATHLLDHRGTTDCTSEPQNHARKTSQAKQPNASAVRGAGPIAAGISSLPAPRTARILRVRICGMTRSVCFPDGDLNSALSDLHRSTPRVRATSLQRRSFQ